MDNLTHSLVGLMLSQAGLNRLLPRATPLLIVAANMPDVDLLWSLSSGLRYLEYHRGFTHSLFFLPLMAVASVAVVRLATRTALPWLRASIAAAIGVLSHLLLDWTNVYGIRLSLPFQGTWHRLDITNVWDVWIWAVLLLAVAGPLLSRLVTGEIGGKASKGQGAAIAVLLMLAVYEAGRYVLHGQAVELLQNNLYAGEAPRRASAFPSPTNPFRWTGVAETDDAIHLFSMNVARGFDPTRGNTFYRPETQPAISVAQQTVTVQRYLRFSQVPFWRVTPLPQPERSVRVEVLDLRFGTPQEPAFVATVDVHDGNTVLREDFRMR